MKYWVFQNNQVIGPYAPDDLGRLVTFTPESLVCSEGRKGTSMGDWQRAGMVPDLSVALVKAGQRQPARGGLATLSGLPPEPTLKDLAVLGSLQEKVAMLEDVAAQLQEGIRLKDAELSAVHGALADKDREASEAKHEAELQRRESEDLKTRLAAFEERLSGVNALSASLDKAVEAERQVQDDVLKQGETIAALAAELETLRRRLEDRASATPAPAGPATTVAPASASARAAAPDFSAPPPASPDFGGPPAALDIGVIEPVGAPPAVVPRPETAGPALDIEFPSSVQTPTPAPEPSGFGLPASPMPQAAGAGFDPLMSAEPFPVLDAGGDPAGASAPAAAVPVEDLLAPAAPAPKPGKGKAVLVGALAGVLALGGVGAAFFMGLIPGMGPAAPEPVVEAPVAAPEPVAPPPPAVDPRQEAVALAKMWTLSGGQTLGAKLDSVAPASGSLSPWMAESLPDGRVQVNYFASGAAAGSPTIAYEFVVDLAGKSLSGRNAAAKSILTGKAPTPPKPLPARAVKVKPKKTAAKAADDEGIDALLGGEDAAPAAKAAPAIPTATKAAEGTDADVEALLMPGFNEKAAAAPTAESRAPKPARVKGRPARGGKKAGSDKASDEALLDDLLED